MNNLKFALVVWFTALTLVGSGRLLGAAEGEGMKEPASAEAVDGKVFAASDLDGLKSMVGQAVTVEGTVAKMGQASGGTVRFLNFSQPFWKSVALVFFTEKTRFPVETLESYVGKRVKATGTLSEYNSKLRLEIEQPEQIEILPAEAAAEDAEKAVPAAE